MPALANFGMHNSFSRIIAEKVMGIAKDAPLPHWSTEGTFGSWFKNLNPNGLNQIKKWFIIMAAPPCITSRLLAKRP
ncbi:MAG: hypothetical protein M5U34_27485 [Chloroflexi bacterium]|nr:hypothetical protein [Chloroflexota bacterium]